MAASTGLRKFRLALVQLAVGADKAANLARAEGMVREAAQNGAKIVSLPECFNCPYGTSYFPEYAEPVPGNTTNQLSKLAKECNIYLIGGSIPEKDNDKIYNTCTVFGPQGDLLGKYRKMHLFNIDIPGKIRFQESETLTGGDKPFIFDTEWCKIGIGICYDIRFSELAAIYGQKGAKLLIYPGAFNTVTGPLHWELLIRANAVQNQVYMAAVSPAQDMTASYHAHGHSTISNPSGTVIATTEEKENIVYGDIDLDFLDECRAGIPVSQQKRHDVYNSATQI